MDQDTGVAGLLHDLNNIFQTLVGAAYRLSEDPQWEPVAAAILRSVERGRHVTMSLEANRAPGVQTILFQTILDDAIAFLEDARLVGGGPRVRFACSVDPAVALPGSWAWERVLINLFLNSVQAMPEGGLIEVEAARHGSQIRLVVRDTGRGIAPEVLDRLFEPGVSTNGTSGLGLHVVKSIVEQHGGSVEASNRKAGKGAEFVIGIPAARLAKPNQDKSDHAKPARA